MRQIFLDTETTGLSPSAGHRIVEIACIEVVSGKPTGRELHHYIDPQCEVPTDAAAIHGLTSALLNGKPLERTVLYHEEIMNGGSLVFEMTDRPAQWGRDAQ